MKSRSARGPRSSCPPGLYQVLWAVSIMGLSASRPPLCQQECIWLLGAFMKEMGNSSSIGPLYTPEDVTVCYADNLDCFYLELQVVQDEQGGPSKTLSRLTRRLEQLRRKLPASRSAACPPCQAHPEKPVAAFLRRLLEMFQWSCSTGPPHPKDFSPSTGPGSAPLAPHASPSSPTSVATDRQV